MTYSVCASSAVTVHEPGDSWMSSRTSSRTLCSGSGSRFQPTALRSSTVGLCDCLWSNARSCSVSAVRNGPC